MASGFDGFGLFDPGQQVYLVLQSNNATLKKTKTLMHAKILMIQIEKYGNEDRKILETYLMFIAGRTIR